MRNRAFAVARALFAIFASRADLILATLALRRQLTVIRWHREGVRRYWRWRSRRRAGQPTATPDNRALGRRMAAEDPTRGAPRVHGEIQKLGLELSECTVSRHMPQRPTDPDARQRWRTFLANRREVVAAISSTTSSSSTISLDQPIVKASSWSACAFCGRRTAAISVSRWAR